jgi:hypothetical protein
MFQTLHPVITYSHVEPMTPLYYPPSTFKLGRLPRQYVLLLVPNVNGEDDICFNRYYREKITFSMT